MWKMLLSVWNNFDVKGYESRASIVGGSCTDSEGRKSENEKIYD